MNGTRRSARTLLVYGFAISVAVHLLVLPLVRPLAIASAHEHEPDMLLTRVPTPPPKPRLTPTPAPSPRPTVPPRRVQPTAAPRAPHIRIVTLHTEAHAGGVSEAPNAHTDRTRGGPGEQSSGSTAGPASIATPVAIAATPLPQPTPTPLSCARPDVPAATLHAVEPETPPLAQQQGIAGTVDVVVSLDAQSRVVATRVQHSANPVLDAAALAAARGSRFRTEIKDCAPVAADYIFSVEFTAQ